MNVLFLTPPYTVEERYSKKIKNLVGSSLFPPIGITQIAAILEQKGHNVEILDTPIEEMSVNDVAEFLKRNKFDVIGISFMTPMYGKFIQTVERIKPIIEGTPLIAGGVHSTILPRETMEKHPEIDFVVYGEGELTMPELLEAIEGKRELSAVKGIVYRENGEIKITEPRELIENLDDLPFPARHLLKIKKYVPAPSSYRKLPALDIVATRGCPFNCSYCSSRSLFGRKLRSRSPKKVIDEMKLIIDKYNAKEIVFFDDLFTGNKIWVNEVCNLIIKEKINEKIEWSCNTRVDMVDLELLKKMKDAGCWQIHFGIESGSQRILDLIKKGITLKQSRNAVKWCREVGIQTRAYFMLGLPTETKEEIEKTIEFAKEIDPDYAKFSLTTPYPGTELFEVMKKEGKIKTTEWAKYKTMGGFGGGERPYVPEGMTSEEINKYQKRAHKEFYFRPKMLFRFIKRMGSFEEAKMYIKSAIALLKA